MPDLMHRRRHDEHADRDRRRLRGPERLAEFWCAVLGWKVLDRDESTVEIGDGTSMSRR